MKQLLYITLLLFATINLYGQAKEVESRILDFPNLTPDSLENFLKKCKEYDELVNSKIPFDSLNDYQKNIIMLEEYYSNGPYYTGPWGCSWYCAADVIYATASSELDSTKNTNYKASNIHDFDLQTVWIPKNNKYGIGESISITIKQPNPLALTTIEIYNGYCVSEKKWNEYSRIKTFELYINDNYIADLNLADTYNVQIFEIGEFKSIESDNIKVSFKIKDIYKGKKYKKVVVSEINFDGTGDH